MKPGPLACDITNGDMFGMAELGAVRVPIPLPSINGELVLMPGVDGATAVSWLGGPGCTVVGVSVPVDVVLLPEAFEKGNCLAEISL